MPRGRGSTRAQRAGRAPRAGARSRLCPRREGRVGFVTGRGGGVLRETAAGRSGGLAADVGGDGLAHRGREKRARAVGGDDGVSGLSSTRSTRAARCGTGSGAGPGRISSLAAGNAGIVTTNSAPFPRPLLWASIRPTWSSTSRRATVSPISESPLRAVEGPIAYHHGLP